MKNLLKFAPFLLILLIIPFFYQNEPEISSNPKPIVDPSKLISGGPPKDGIPSIDNPQFVTYAESDWLSEDKTVFVLEGETEIKIYPQPILVWHEIVNDFIDDMPVLVTYCPLCQSSIAFERLIDGQIVEFGTSGKLYNSNLVMYDRLTNSYWTQIQGQAIIGELTGKVLKKVPLQVMTYGDAKLQFPNASVLSRETGHLRDYTKDPYTNYYESDSLFFPVEVNNNVLNSKEIVVGLTINGESKAYPEITLIQEGFVEDNLGGVDITLNMSEKGFLKIIDQETNKRLAWERDYWFAWAAFHPDTKVYSS